MILEKTFSNSSFVAHEKIVLKTISCRVMILHKKKSRYNPSPDAPCGHTISLKTLVLWSLKKSFSLRR